MIRTHNYHPKTGLKAFGTLMVAIVLLVCTSVPVISGAKPKVLYINSYHFGYSWSDDIEKGLLSALGATMTADGHVDTSKSNVELRIFRMNTKLNTDEKFKREASLKAKKIIESWKPDVVLASDDNASKYLIEPYYKGSELPFLFCGVNWDATDYGFPTSNITGMVEVAPLRATLNMLKEYANGDRVGYIGSENISNRKALLFHKSVSGVNYTDGGLYTDFADWKRGYSKLQGSVDMLVMLSPIGIPDWDDREAELFILNNTKIPSGATEAHTSRLALLGRVKIAEEQGWWIGKKALEILNGVRPADIPVTKNSRSRVYVNMDLANQLGVKFPMDLLQAATMVQEQE